MSEYVLVVDDDPDVRTLIIDALTLFGIDGQVAYNGSEALEKVAAAPPSAIVIDLMMPGMNGFSTITRLHRNAASRTIPVIVLSGVADTSVMKLPGVVGVIRKGDFSIKTFRKLLETAGLSAANS